MTLRSDWANWCTSLACTPSGDYFWSGSRIILSNKVWEVPRLDESLKVGHVGYTDYKISRLNTQYFVPDAVEVAMMLHDLNVKKRRYASSSFHCYGHLLKIDPEKKSKHGSLMGPCIQSVVITCKPSKNRTEVDVFYRTTEVFKKFPGDLIWLRDCILPLIPGQAQYPVALWRFHFVNVTCHPMYISAMLPNLPNPVATMNLLRDRNTPFYQECGRWLCRYLVGGAVRKSIAKFAQAQRTADTAVEAFDADPLIKASMLGHLYANRRLYFGNRSSFSDDDVVAAFKETMGELPK